VIAVRIFPAGDPVSDPAGDSDSGRAAIQLVIHAVTRWWKPPVGL
jgi:hypothetical protein